MGVQGNSWQNRFGKVLRPLTLGLHAPISLGKSHHVRFVGDRYNLPDDRARD
jgi:hypothetical protein